MSAEQAFQPSRLRLARHFWGTTLQELSERLGVTRQYVSQLETGAPRLALDDPIVSALADGLSVAPTFFFRTGRHVLAEEQAHFRKLATTKVSMKQKVLARGTLFDEFVTLLCSKVKLPRVNLPDLSGAHTAEELERAAERARAHWDLGFGAIENMIRVAERAGVVVAFFHEASREVDALSITGTRPVIVRNDAKASPCRQRFDVAHELGHLLMHEGQVTGDRKTESEANRFASAFLLPRSTFLKAFPRRGSRLDWGGLSQLKLKFGVSKAALLYRAKSLDLLDESQYRGAVITLKNRGEAIQESEDDHCVRESAELVAKALAFIANKHGLSSAHLAEQLGVNPVMLAEVLPPEAAPSVEAKARPALRLIHNQAIHTLAAPPALLDVHSQSKGVAVMSKGRDRTVFRRDDGTWVNKRNDAGKASSTHQTQKAAEDSAREMLHNQGGGELTTKSRDGQIRSKDTIAPGKDPNPPRDKEH